MRANPFAALVALSAARPRLVALLALLACAGLGGAATRLDVDTDTRHLMAADLPWRQVEDRIDRAFPQFADLVLVVVEGETPAEADRAAGALTSRLQGLARNGGPLEAVRRPDALPYFRENGLLFLPKDDLDALGQKLVEAQPLLGLLTADPSLRGLARALGLAAQAAAEDGQPGVLDTLLPAFRAVEGSLATLDAGYPRPPAWSDLLTGRPPAPEELARLILVRPVLDHAALEPGAVASAAIRDAARDLGLTPERGVMVRLTGPVPLADEEFASLRSGAGLATGLTLAGTLALLLLGLRSPRLVLAVVVTLAAGLAATAGLAALAVGSLNLISVAFAALFIGIAVDFGIQLGVRFGEERRHLGLRPALEATGRGIAGSLALAAAATSLGFLAFVPTDYTGVAELGAIAGAGMIVALLLDLTLLPALIAILNAHPRVREAGQPWAAPVDRFLLERRRPLRLALLALGVAAAIPAARLPFDADPLSLKDPHSESMQALGTLMRQPAANPYTATVLAPSEAAAEEVAARLRGLPEVGGVMTLASLVPEDQSAKLAILDDLRMLLGPVLSPPEAPPRPALEETRAALRDLAGRLDPLPADVAAPLRGQLERLAAGPDAGLERAERLLLDDLLAQLDQLRAAILGPTAPVTIDAIPPEIREDWVADSGEARAVASPAGDARDVATLRRFVDAVRVAEPGAGGDAVSIVEAGRTVAGAFTKALVLASVAAATLLLAVLRRPRDVALVLAPLALAGVLTAGTWAALGGALNFANIIALPLMLGIGVAFNIYFVVAWRRGRAGPLESSLARATLFSALTTMTAFASLASTPHPGTRSMGELLTLALAFTVATTLLALPPLLGLPPASGAGKR